MNWFKPNRKGLTKMPMKTNDMIVVTEPPHRNDMERTQKLITALNLNKKAFENTEFDIHVFRKILDKICPNTYKPRSRKQKQHLLELIERAGITSCTLTGESDTPFTDVKPKKKKVKPDDDIELPENLSLTIKGLIGSIDQLTKEIARLSKHIEESVVE